MRPPLRLLLAFAGLALVAAGCPSSTAPAADGADRSGPDASRPDAPARDQSRADAGQDARAGLTEAELAALDSYVTSRMKTAQTPGLAAAVVKGGKVVLTRGFGFADLAAQRKVTPDTLFQLASVSKTVTAVALMQLQEKGLFKLDDDINARLSYAVRNPSYPAVPITYRMLLAHTSSIQDQAPIDDLVVEGKDSPVALDVFLKGYLTSGGTYYDPTNWHKEKPPGGLYDYSNAGVALAGDLVEIIAGRNLQEQCVATIFGPLGMTESSWFLKGLDPSHLAVPYTVDAKGGFVAGPHLGWPTYPDGQLRTSASQLARFLLAFVEQGQLDGVRLLSAQSVTEMRKQQPGSEEGLSWGSWELDQGRTLIGHGGAYIGVSTDMWFDPQTGGGFVMLTNGSTYYDFEEGPAIDALDEINLKLLELSDRL